MLRKTRIIVILVLLVLSSLYQFSSAQVKPGEISSGSEFVTYRNVTVYAPAVASTESGYIGVISTITVTIQNGSGRVFVDTMPLTQVDMQGSARLAVKVASALVEKDENCDVDPSSFDYFFVVRTSAPIIGGPSAGAIMTVATIALLENWEINDYTVMTGMINPDASVGPVGGIIHKIEAGYSVGATRFLIPKGQGTYTELVTKTVTEGIWRRTITYPETRDVAEYAMDNYGIEVVEVEEINDALRYFTGFNFSKTVSDQRITTEDYIDSMKPLASTLLSEAEDMYYNASDLFDNSSIPNAYPTYYRSQVSNSLSDSLDLLQQSMDLYDQGLYYSSTSKSFNSLINSRFVRYSCEYFNTVDRDIYFTNLIENISTFYDEQSIKAKNAEICGMISLQCVGAAQRRVSESEDYISDASEIYEQYDHLGALYKLSFGMERSRSVGWWLNISNFFNDTCEISEKVLESLAAEYIEDAQQSVVYSSVILQEVGESSTYLTEAEELIESARDNLEEDYDASAFFKALEALAKGNLALELLDSNPEERINRARDSASSSISDSRDLGIEPVLAVSYFELAHTFVNESAFSVAIEYYKYSDIIAGALGFINLTEGTSSSRYVGSPEIGSPSRGFGFTGFFEFVIIVILAGIAGLGLGLIIGDLSSKKKEEKDDYSQWTPKSIEDYYKKNK